MAHKPQRRTKRQKRLAAEMARRRSQPRRRLSAAPKLEPRIHPALRPSPPAPIDLIKTFLTGEQVFGRRLGRAYAEKILAKLNLRAAMTGLAYLLARRQNPTESFAQAETDLIASLQPDFRAKVQKALWSNSVIASPQALMLAMRIALRICPEDGGETANGIIVPALLALHDDLEAPKGPRPADPLDTEHQLFREIVRSQVLAARWDYRSQMAHVQLRWHDYPGALGLRSEVNPADAFQNATGVSLEDFTGVGTAFWVGGINHPGTIVRFPTEIRWDDERRERTLGLFTARVPQLREAVSQVVGVGEHYAFDQLRRWPVLRFGDDEFLVLSPDLLFDRIFGAPRLLDIKDAIPEAERDTRWRPINETYQRMCEFDAMEAVRRIAKREGHAFYSEQQLRAAYEGRGVRIAEAAIDTGDGWIVVEVSARRLTRPTVIDADAEALKNDIELGVKRKFEQIDSIVSRLIDDETRLTGGPLRERTRFTRILVVADGFPVNPMTYEAIQRATATEVDPRLGPGHVIDQEELDIIESIVERGEGTLLGLVFGHEHAALMRAAFKDYILEELELDVPRPERLAEPGDKIWEPAFRAYGMEPPGAEGA